LSTRNGRNPQQDDQMDAVFWAFSTLTARRSRHCTAIKKFISVVVIFIALVVFFYNYVLVGLASTQRRAYLVAKRRFEAQRKRVVNKLRGG